MLCWGCLLDRVRGLDREGIATPMKDHDDTPTAAASGRRLREAVWRARTAQAEQSDVIVDLRAAEVARLEMLRAELDDVVTDTGEDDGFSFQIAHGTPPRLWIDLLAFVKMARDRKTYRFLKDTRSGRQVILESADVKVTAGRIIDYVAHAIVERQKALADDHGLVEPDQRPVVADARDTAAVSARRPRRGLGPFGALLLFVLGAAAGAAGLLAYGYLAVP